MKTVGGNDKRNGKSNRCIRCSDCVVRVDVLRVFDAQKHLLVYGHVRSMLVVLVTCYRCDCKFYVDSVNSFG